MSWEHLLAELRQWSPLEIPAAALALLYLILAARQNIWCWACAFVSSALYLYVFFDREIYQQSALQIFYLVMAVYGYWNWRHGGRDAREAKITTWSMRTHLSVAVSVAILTLVTGWTEDSFTSAPFPYLDAFTTWGAVITTWMVTRKILENWLYWLVVDGVSIYLFLVSGLPATALLFVIYLGIVIAGYFAWRRTLRQQPA